MPKASGGSASRHGSDADGKPKDVARKLKHLCKALEVSEQTLVDEMHRHHKSRKDDVRGWLDGSTPPKQPSLVKLTEYWNGVANGFKHYLWLVEYEHFLTDVHALKSSQDTVSINLPCTGVPLAEEEINGLVGTYETYRKAFANDGRVSRERLVINHAKDGSRVMLDIEMHAVSTEEAEEDDGGTREEVMRGDVFRGHLFRLGTAYYIVASVRHPDRGRIRFLCLPVGQRPGLRRRWGIISGVTGHTKLPAAARILIKKVPKAGVPQRAMEEKVGLKPEERCFVSNDINQKLATYRDRDAVLTVSGEFD